MASHGDGAPFYFHGHYEVVPAQSAEQFQPQRKDHFVFGRGASDMKGGIVSMLYAIVALKECDVEMDGKINLVLVPDEETGSARGSARLAEQGIPGRDGLGMLLAEPTSGAVWNGNRGAISLHVRVFGKSAHVGLQHRGEKRKKGTPLHAAKEHPPAMRWLKPSGKSPACPPASHCARDCSAPASMPREASRVTLTDRHFFPLRTVRTSASTSAGWLNAPRSTRLRP